MVQAVLYSMWRMLTFKERSFINVRLVPRHFRVSVGGGVHSTEVCKPSPPPTIKLILAIQCLFKKINPFLKVKRKRPVNFTCFHLCILEFREAALRAPPEVAFAMRSLPLLLPPFTASVQSRPPGPPPVPGVFFSFFSSFFLLFFSVFCR